MTARPSIPVTEKFSGMFEKPKCQGWVILRTVGLGVLVTASLMAAWPAYAHNEIVATNPNEGETVVTQPEEFAVVTSDQIISLSGESGRNVIQITGPGDTELYYGDGCAIVDGTTVSMVGQLGEPGEYTMSWNVISIDTHPTPGELTFTWAPQEGEILAQGSTTPPECGVTNVAPPIPNSSQSQSSTEPSPATTERTTSETQGESSNSEPTVETSHEAGSVESDSDASNQTVPLAVILIVASSILVLAILVITIVVIGKRRRNRSPAG